MGSPEVGHDHAGLVPGVPAEALAHPEHDPVADRADRGRDARKRVPRSSMAEWEPDADRPDPLELLEEQARTRLPELVPIRYGRMASSPFAFYRGAAAIMAADLARTPDTGIITQLCGDAHLLNFGIYLSPERRLVFDLNDFDETLPGPFEWDLKRLAASLAVAGQENGYTEAQVRSVVKASVAEYRRAMADFAGMSNLRLWYVRLEVEQLVEAFREKISTAELKGIRRQTSKFASRDSLQAFGKLTEQTEDGPRFRSAPPLVVPAVELFADHPAYEVHDQARRVLKEYLGSLADDRKHLAQTYLYVDLARKVVGVGSVGTRAWMVLLLGRDDNDPLILQVKEAQASVLEKHLGKHDLDGHGHRVVAGQRLMQASSDIFLGWYHGFGMDQQPRDFYVRQLRDGKGGVDVATMSPAQLKVYGEVCAWTLARGHARSGDRVAVAAYVGTSSRLDDALTEFSLRYAEQNRRDHAALVDAIEGGRLTAVHGL